MEKMICSNCKKECEPISVCQLCGEKPEPIDLDYIMCRYCQDHLAIEIVSECCGEEILHKYKKKKRKGYRVL